MRENHINLMKYFWHTIYYIFFYCCSYCYNRNIDFKLHILNTWNNLSKSHLYNFFAKQSKYLTIRVVLLEKSLQSKNRSIPLTIYKSKITNKTKIVLIYSIYCSLFNGYSNCVVIYCNFLLISLEGSNLLVYKDGFDLFWSK